MALPTLPLLRQGAPGWGLARQIPAYCWMPVAWRTRESAALVSSYPSLTQGLCSSNNQLHPLWPQTMFRKPLAYPIIRWKQASGAPLSLADGARLRGALPACLNAEKSLPAPKNILRMCQRQANSTQLTACGGSDTIGSQDNSARLGRVFFWQEIVIEFTK